MQEPNYIQIISENLGIQQWQVEIVLNLISQGATVPFISRYRKEQTGNLDENQIREIIEIQKKEENLYKAKQTAISGIDEQGKLTPELESSIINCKTLKEVEEIYKPYKSKKKTKAMIAIEKGFQPVADSIKNNDLIIPEKLLEDYTQEEILLGAYQIIGAEISANTDIRHFLLDELKKHGLIKSSKKTEKSLEKLNDKDKKQIPKFEIYFDFEIKISKIKAYQILALNRGENLGILNVKVPKDEMIIDKTFSYYLDLLGIRTEPIQDLKEGFKIGIDALYSSVENQIRSELNELAQDESINTFQINLSGLLMTKPQYGQRILAIDPGFRAGCKIAIIDELGDALAFDKIFINDEIGAKSKIQDLVKEYNIDVLVIGNGTGTDDVQNLVGEIFDGDIYIVNESGASVYSASKVAQEEFPDLDDLDRGTVSIARRYVDPLSELVKIPVGSIGVGLYQHDMPAKKLEEKLGYVVEDSVNKVGINVNTASVYLLNHISGIDKRQAKKIYNNKPYKSRQDLQKVLSEKSYEQAIGFLRVPESEEKLDQTDIHPQQYDLAKYIISNNLTKLDDKMKELYPDANQGTVDFIIQSYKNIAKDPRENFAHSKAKKPVSINDLKEGDELEGVVRNVVAFGAFVDIGLKNDGLVHISQLANEFVSNPMDIVKVGDIVKVKIIGVDLETGKTQLSMKGV